MGNLWSHSLRGSRGECIEYLLCHVFKLIGSKVGQNAATGGVFRAKLLLTDKLNLSERERVLQIHGREQALQRKKEAGTTLDDHWFGSPGATENGHIGAAPSKPNGNDCKKSGKVKAREESHTLHVDKKRGHDRPVENEDVVLAPGNDITGAQDSLNGLLRLPNPSVSEGILPGVLRRLVEQRKQVKKL
ncbi:DNA polymerase alpha catalytic subunit [Gracilaria domingensis]|nr:DNA polymerase alpha catalytic subunit [Gracilaria domingensis]